MARVLTMITAAVAAVAVVVIALAVLDRPGPDHRRRPHLDLASGLLVTTRTELRLCVEAGHDRRPTVQGRLLAALDEVRRQPGWRDAYGRSRYARSSALAWGCPAPRLPDRYEPEATVAGPGVTAEPSPFRVWVYVLDELTADRLLGAGAATGLAMAELFRAAASVYPVSTALLVRESHLADTGALAQDLRAALGLEEPPD